jgi:multidrug resistance efflux pump
MAHQLKARQLEADVSQRVESLATATGMVERATKELASRRAALMQHSSGRASELELVRDELRRRAALPRVAELNAPKERSFTLDDRPPRASLEP